MDENEFDDVYDGFFPDDDDSIEMDIVREVELEGRYYDDDFFDQEEVYSDLYDGCSYYDE